MELTDSPVKDFPLLWKVYDHIVAHPKEWDQTMWARKVPECGTSFCFAGHVVNMMRPDLTLRFSCAEEMQTACVVDKDGVLYDIDLVATELLGLTDEESGELFCAINPLNRIRDLIAGWEAEELSNV